MTTIPSATPASLSQAQALPSAGARRSTLRNALIITRREVRDSFRDWRIVTPIILLTLLFPFLAQGVATSFRNFLEGYGAQLIGERTIPFLLMVVGFFPISISLVIALETFVGEKERRSLEPLLSTPLTNTELYIGKMLSSMIPPLLASFGGMCFYLATLLGGELAWRPQPMLIVQIFLLTIIQALVMVTGAVVVSSQTTSTRAANLLASFIIIPMTLVINGESVIMFLAPDAESPYGISALWAIMAGMAVVVVLLLRLGNSIFNREELLGRNIDSINLGRGIRNIIRHTMAVDAEGTRARNLFDWYRRSVTFSLGNLRTALAITAGVFICFFTMGYLVGTTAEWRLPLPPQEQLQETLPFINDFFTAPLRQQAMSFIFIQNGRVLFGSLLLSIFSFGVMAFILPPFSIGVLGYLLAQMVQAGYDLNLFFAAVVPHGIVEIPIIIIATAAMFRLGAIVTRPPTGQTVGQAWIRTLGETIKIAIAIVVPGLMIAALLEVWLTPAVVLSALP